MRKILLSILTFFYLVASIGAPMEAHYCMGKLRDSGIGLVLSQKACPHCGMANKKGCCDAKQTLVKLDKQYDAPFIIHQAFHYAADRPVDHFITATPIRSYPQVLSQSLDPSPPGRTLPLYISHCIYRI